MKQRTEGNALRSHLYEFGHVTPHGSATSRDWLTSWTSGRHPGSRARDLPHAPRAVRAPDRQDHGTVGEDRRDVERGGDATTPANDAGRRADHRACRRDFRTADGAVPPRTRLRGMARSRQPHPFLAGCRGAVAARTRARRATHSAVRQRTGSRLPRAARVDLRPNIETALIGTSKPC